MGLVRLNKRLEVQLGWALVLYAPYRIVRSGCDYHGRYNWGNHRYRVWGKLCETEYCLRGSLLRDEQNKHEYFTTGDMGGKTGFRWGIWEGDNLMHSYRDTFYIYGSLEAGVHQGAVAKKDNIPYIWRMLVRYNTPPLIRAIRQEIRWEQLNEQHV